MKGVIDEIHVKSIPRTDKWELLEPFDWYGITVPAGFVTDFASIPDFFKGFINPVGKIKPAALVHDWLYNKRGKLEDRTLTRKQCDKEFLKIMKIIGMSFFKRQSAYRAVRSFGWIPWRKKESKTTP